MSDRENQVETLLQRAFMFLEDRDWEKADEYAERVLDVAPENSDAYLCKLLCELKLSGKNTLKNCAENYSDNKNFQKALKFADGEQEAFLNESLDSSRELNKIKEEKRSRKKEKENIEDEIKLWEDGIETFRYMQKSNNYLMKKGKRGAIFYFITYILMISAITVLCVYDFDNEGYITFGSGVLPIFALLMLISYTMVSRFWALDYKIKRTWVIDYCYGSLNLFFTAGIVGLVNSIKALIECKELEKLNEEYSKEILNNKERISDCEEKLKKLKSEK